MEKSDHSDFVPNDAFKKFFNSFIIKQYNGNLPAFYKELRLSETSVRRWVDGTPPNSKNLQIILNSHLDDEVKHKFAETALLSVYTKQIYFNNKGMSLGSGGGVNTYIQLKNFPVDLKKYWEEKYKGFAPPEGLNDLDKNFETILIKYAEKKTATFQGLIQTYWEAIGKPNYNKLAYILNVERRDIARWFDPELQDTIPLGSTLKAIAGSPFIQLSDKGKECLSRIARGSHVFKADEDEGGIYHSLEEIQKAYAKKLSLCKDFKEKDKISRELYQKCIEFTGYSDYTMAEKTGFGPSRFADYRKGVHLIEGILCANPNDAFTLAGAIAGDNENLKNNLAANFLNLTEYRDLPAIKKAFFLGGPTSEAFLYTRLLVKKMTRENFCNCIDINRKTLPGLETGEERRTFYVSVINLANMQWELSGNEPKLVLKAIVNDALSKLKYKDDFLKRTAPKIAEKLGLSETESFWTAEIEPEKPKPPASHETNHTSTDLPIGRFEKYYAEEIANKRNPQNLTYKIKVDLLGRNFTSTSQDGFEFGGRQYTDSAKNLDGFIAFLIDKKIDPKRIDVFNSQHGTQSGYEYVEKKKRSPENNDAPASFEFAAPYKSSKIEETTKHIGTRKHGNDFLERLIKKEPSLKSKTDQTGLY